jgi:cytoskeletal protein RodZ
VKFGTLSAIIVLTTIMISTIDLSQNFVFAQNTTSITPASELAGSNDDESTSSEDNESDNESTTDSSESDDNADSVDMTTSNDDGSDSEDVTSSEEEEDSEQTNPLLEEIRNRVSGALSATGMQGTGF